MSCPHCRALRQELTLVLEALAVVGEELARAHTELAQLRPPVTDRQLRAWQENAQLVEG